MKNEMHRSRDDRRRRQLVGKIEQILPRSLFRVALERGGIVLGHVALSERNVMGRIVEGDSVVVELSEYDNRRGRIVSHRPSSPR